MRMRLALSIVTSVCLTACPGDDGGGGGTTVAMTSMPPTTGDATVAGDDDGVMTTGGPPASTGAVDDSESGTPPPGSTDTGGELSGFLDDDGPQCDTNVQGEWNACVNEMGQVQTTLCNYMGDSDANGFIGCLTSGEMEGANTCFINGCVDVCDCFPPPATGTAVVVCEMILADGGFGCALDCGGGEMCPDGMECIGGTCFWPGTGGGGSGSGTTTM